MENLTPQRKRTLAENILEIVQNNELSHEETRKLFRPDAPNDKSPHITRAADQIIQLFIREKLSVAEGSEVIKTFLYRQIRAWICLDKITAGRRMLGELYEAKGCTDAEVLAVSMSLDKLLNQYHHLTVPTPPSGYPVGHRKEMN